MCLIKRGLNLCLRCFEKKASSGDHVSGVEYVDFSVARNKLVTRGIFEALILTKFMKQNSASASALLINPFLWTLGDFSSRSLSLSRFCYDYRFKHIIYHHQQPYLWSFVVLFVSFMFLFSCFLLFVDFKIRSLLLPFKYPSAKRERGDT